MIEPKRGCGYRKVGGLYLVGYACATPCDRLPFPLHHCPVCGSGIKPTRGLTRIDPVKLLGTHQDCTDKFPCFFCDPTRLKAPTYLLWVGEAFYTPDSFIQEALKMGISRRIPHLPKDFVIGESCVLLAHRKAYKTPVVENTPFGDQIHYEPSPGIFYAFFPSRVEKLIWRSEATDENLALLERRGITPIIVPDGDPDHDPKRSIYRDIKPRHVQRRLI